MPARHYLLIVLSTIFAVNGPSTSAQDQGKVTPTLSAGDRIAIIGDSITEQKVYSKYMEAYLLACSGVPDLRVFQFGWSGEQAGGFSNRMENDLGAFNPTVASLCYGMNDGGYQPYREEIGKTYENNMRSILDKLEKLGTKTVVVGSPGAVDTYFFRPGQFMGSQPSNVAYNDTLAHLRDIDRTLATERNKLFADVHQTMLDAMVKAQETLGKEYDVCGRDGFHPGNNGQLLMAYAFLKGLNLSGNIGEIVVNLNGKSKSTDGHSITGGSGGKLDIESVRWPFCFQGDGKSSSSTRSILPFTNFNADLNRFILKVEGLDASHATVKWGSVEKTFTKDELTNGINLTEHFSETPFDSSFDTLLGAIARKQNFETYMIKTIITDFRSFPEDLSEDTELQGAAQILRERLTAKHNQLHSIVHASLSPVKHSLQITSQN